MAIKAAAQLDMRTMAVWLSVILTESTMPFSGAAFSRTCVYIGASRWAQLAGKGEVPRFENFGKIAFTHKLSLCSQCDPVG